jgi:hypothetical protein
MGGCCAKNKKPTGLIMGQTNKESFRRVQYVVCFLLGNSPASEFYVPKIVHKIQTPGNYPEENIQQIKKGYAGGACRTRRNAYLIVDSSPQNI